jgi:putative ABC transport system permease protein
VVWQLALRRLTRNAVQYFPLLLLLILTVSLGIYSAATARTLSKNFEDRIRYEVGADLAVTEEWHSPDNPSPSEPTSEPPFLKRLELPGVRSAARVLKGSVAVAAGGPWTLRTPGAMMAIEPSEFARTAWFRSDFAKAPFFDYLALLSRHHEGVLVSRAYFEGQKLAVGDSLGFTYDEQPFEAYVAGVVDYWPTMDPTRSPFFVFNLEFVQENTRLAPYEVWYRLSDHEHVQEMVSGLVTIGVYPTQVKDAEAMITALNREPYRMGFFGILSFGFLISSLITVLGFLVYTYFSIKGRVVQFGALRAMGFSGLQLSVLMIVEQFFTLGAGLGLGTGLGLVCSGLFLPFLRVRAAELQPVPPFLLISDRTDVLYVMAVLGVLFLVAVAGLTAILARMKVNRALTLGEESET